MNFTSGSWGAVFLACRRPSPAWILARLLESDHPGAYLLPVDSLFRQYPEVTLTANQEKRCRNGNAFSLNREDGTYRAYSADGEFLMLARVESGVMSTIKSFFGVPGQE